MKIPSPGESITEVEIASWLVSDGEFVKKDQIIAEIDSDKATLELPAEESGVIAFAAEEGDVVKVGQVVCKIDVSAKETIQSDGSAPKFNSAEVAQSSVKNVSETVQKGTFLLFNLIISASNFLFIRIENFQSNSDITTTS